MNKASVAIVILNYNGRHFLERFLPSVLASTYAHAEICIADNASTDDSVEFMRNKYPDVRLLLLDKNYGFAGGYNRALEQIDSDYFLLLNSDVRVEPDWLEPMLALIEGDPKIAAVQPKILMEARPELFEHAGGSGGFIDSMGYPFCRGRIFMELEKDEGQYQDMVEIFWASGAAFLIRADLYRRFGGLDADYFAHMEEIDLCWRMKLAGYQIMVMPESSVYHVGGGTLPVSNPRKTYLNFRNSLVTIYKNMPGKKLIWLLPYRLLLDGLAGLRFLSEGKIREIGAILRAHFSFYRTIRKTLRKKKINLQIIEKERIGAPNLKGMYKGSIVWDFFLRKKHRFKDLYFKK